MPERVVLILMSSLVVLSCGSSTTTATGSGEPADSALVSRMLVADAQSQPQAATSGALLQECDLPNVSIVPTALPTGSVDQATAERAVSNIGARTPVAIGLPALVTIGQRFGEPPNPSAILKDINDQPILSRPAWVLVYRGQSIQRPSAGPARPKLATNWPSRAPLLPVITVAAIVDAQSGSLLMGWGCDRPLR